MNALDAINLEGVLFAAIKQAQSASLWPQLAVIAVAITAAWLLARPLSRLHGDSTVWKFGLEGLERVARPGLALIFVWLGKVALVRAATAKVPVQDALLQLAAWLLLSLLIIRFLVFVLRHLQPSHAPLKRFEQTVAWTVWIALVLQLTGLLPEIVTALEDVKFSIGKQSISLAALIGGALSVVFALAITLWISRLIEGRVMGAETVDMSTRIVFVKFVRALLLLIGVLIALAAAGIDLTILSVFGGALGVGLGFGLQKIASNYVSGFIILMDRSIRIGDFVNVENRRGVIRGIYSRYSVIRSLDGTESIIPNETFVTNPVTNFSYSDRVVMLIVPLAIEYASEVDRALEILVDCARAQPRVVKSPEPSAQITRMGDFGIEVELYVWIADPENGQNNLRGGIYREVLKRFAEAGIEIPYPRHRVEIVPPSGSDVANVVDRPKHLPDTAGRVV